MAAIAHNPAFAKKVGIPQSVGKDFNEADKGRKFGKGGSAMAQMAETLAKPKPPAPAIKVRGSGSRADLQQINSPKTNQGKNELFKKGGDTMAKSDMKEDMKMDKAQDKAMIKKAFKQHDMQEHKGGKGTELKLKKGGKAKRFNGEDGSDVEDDTSELTAYTPPKTMPSRPVSKTPSAAKPAAKPVFSNYSNEGRNKAAPAETDKTKMSVSDRIKSARSQSREGTTDTRSVGERMRSAFGMAKGGMASGGSASSRADGCATKGKTKGTMVMRGGGMARGKR